MAVSERNQNKLTDIGIKVGLGLLGFLGLRKMLQMAAQDNAAEQLGNDPNVQYAQMIRAALNGSGNSWLSWADGTDEKALYKVAEKIKDWPRVAQAYKNLYRNNIADDLTSELSSEELIEFFRLLALPKNTANNALTEYAIKNGFKYRVGTKLKSNPVAGTSRIGYVKTSKKNGKIVLDVVLWNTKAGSLVGTIDGYAWFSWLDGAGKKRTERFYLVKDIPNQSPGVKYYVLESETLPINK